MRSKVVLLLSLVMAIITTALFFQYIKKIDSTTTVATTKMVEVAVALDQIEKNERITDKKIEMVKMEENNVHPDAIKNKEAVIGKLATAVIVKGEQVLSPRLVSEKKENTYVSRKIREGYRAVSVGVNINQSVTNLIEPEDEVDVIFTKTQKVGSTEKVSSDFILKKARVLAVGRKLVNPEDSEEAYVEYSSVTLELKPEDALMLIRSSQEGSIHFILNQRPVEKEVKLIESDQG
ncbi:MAG TPA: Flp pilus assembly protein CpaB [Pseudoneobacillus sp.]|nr:Flp pilus assembly protein CpaB [Pseudoneobacillus sp.]